MGITEAPEFAIEFMESESKEGPFGGKGVAEIGIIMVSGAVANAVFEATGARVTSLLLMEEKGLMALSKSSLLPSAVR